MAINASQQTLNLKTTSKHRSLKKNIWLKSAISVLEHLIIVIIINNNIHASVYGAVIITESYESSLGRTDVCRLRDRWPPTSDKA